jgi:hypothetical protein
MQISKAFQMAVWFATEPVLLPVSFRSDRSVYGILLSEVSAAVVVLAEAKSEVGREGGGGGAIRRRAGVGDDRHFFWRV